MKVVPTFGATFSFFHNPSHEYTSNHMFLPFKANLGLFLIPKPHFEQVTDIKKHPIFAHFCKKINRDKQASNAYAL